MRLSQDVDIAHAAAAIDSRFAERDYYAARAAYGRMLGNCASELVGLEFKVAQTTKTIIEDFTNYVNTSVDLPYGISAYARTTDSSALLDGKILLYMHCDVLLSDLQAGFEMLTLPEPGDVQAARNYFIEAISYIAWAHCAAFDHFSIHNLLYHLATQQDEALTTQFLERCNKRLQMIEAPSNYKSFIEIFKSASEYATDSSLLPLPQTLPNYSVRGVVANELKMDIGVHHSESRGQLNAKQVFAVYKHYNPLLSLNMLLPDVSLALLCSDDEIKGYYQGLNNHKHYHTRHRFKGGINNHNNHQSILPKSQEELQQRLINQTLQLKRDIARNNDTRQNISSISSIAK